MTYLTLHDSMARGLRWAAMAAGAVLLTATVTVAQGSDSSSADKKPVKKAKVVITDDDLPSHGQDTTADADSAGSQAQATGNPDAKAGSGGGSINVPGLLQNATLVDAENLLERLKHDLQTLEQRYDQQQKKLESAETSTQRQMYVDSLAHREQTVSRKRKQIEDLEGAIRNAKNSGAAQGDQQHATK